MGKLASERGKQVANRRGGGQKCVEKRKKILNRGNELNKSFRISTSAKKRTQNELVFERKKGQTKRKWGRNAGKWKLEIRKPKLENRQLAQTSCSWKSADSSWSPARFFPLPWGEGDPRPAFSPAGAGRVRGRFREDSWTNRGPTNQVRATCWKLENRRPKLGLSVSIFHFPVSNFCFLAFTASLIL
jgi:hypothetical protein